MRRTTPRTTLGSCSTRTAAPMRRNVSSSLKHTQQHNGTLVPARVPFSCLFGQVASMRNQQAQKSTAHFQTQRANARHRPTFPHTHELTHNPVHRRITSPFFPGQMLASPRQARRSFRSNVTNKAVARNPSHGQPAPKPVDVCGPSDPRTHVVMSRRRA